MSLDLRVLDTGKASAEKNMQIDAELLETLSDEAILHFYEWERESATYGYFIRPEKFLHLGNVQKRGIGLARRPTGGGIVFHLWDFAFSVLIPSSSPHFSENTLENYAYVNGKVLEAVRELFGSSLPLVLTPQDSPAFDPSCDSFCMAKPTKYDLVVGGKKIAGAAQRKRRQGFLHQGTISLVMPPEEVLRELLLPGRVAEAMGVYSYPLLGEGVTPQEVEEVKRGLKGALKKQFGHGHAHGHRHEKN